ncbi:MAG: hypothetical protein ACR2P1_08535 [Pseudomonadales bacterium]
MHRSGTSMLARCVHLLGANIARRVIPTDVAINRDGFFEDAEVVALNDELFALLNSCWYDFQPLLHDAADLESIKRWQNKALDHLREEYGGKRLSLIKDPRLSRLWRYWAPIFNQAGLNVDLVHILRRPEHVAVSLNRRNGMPVASGLLLWCAHIIDTLCVMDSDQPWTTFFYGSFLGEPHKNIKLTIAMLGDDIDESDYAFIEGGIGKPRSSTIPSSDDGLVLVPDLDDFASQLYQFLENNYKDGKLTIAQQDAERLNNEYQQLLSRRSAECKTLAVLTHELISLNGKLVEIGELHSQAQNIVAERDGQLGGLNEELSRVGAELKHAQSVVLERDGQLANLGGQLADLSGQLADLNEQIARYESVWFRRACRYVRRLFV